jgi:hypothetical protein
VIFYCNFCFPFLPLETAIPFTNLITTIVILQFVKSLDHQSRTVFADLNVGYDHGETQKRRELFLDEFCRLRDVLKAKAEEYLA